MTTSLFPAAPIMPGATLRFLRRHRLLLATITVIAAIISASLTLLRPREYTSSASFAPQSRKAPVGMSNLASQLGVNIPSTEPSESPDFYGEFVQSPELLGRVIDSLQSQSPPNGSSRIVLADVFEIDGRTPAIRRFRTIKELQHHVSVHVSQKTGVVSISATMENPTLAHAVVQRVLIEVNNFNLTKRQAQAGAERQFMETQVATSLAALHHAEDVQEAFLRENREYNRAPRLVLEQARLEREVSMRQSVYTNLASAYEQAKIDEVRNTPIIAEIEQARVPAEPDSRHLLAKTLLAAVLGLFIGCCVALWREYRNVVQTLQHTD